MKILCHLAYDTLDRIFMIFFIYRICTKHGIQIEYTAPNTPQQNGVVERKFVTIRDRSCAAMINAKLNDEASFKDFFGQNVPTQ
jgi:hypothetical protein